jgi:LysM repeat protein
MNRRALFVFVLLNIVISIGVALAVILAYQTFVPQENTGMPVVQTFEVIITATPGPTQTPWVVTVQAAAPAVGDGSGGGGDEPTVAPTLNADILPGIATAAAETQVAIQASGSQEQTYTVQSGDSPSIIAQNLGVSLSDLLCANDLAPSRTRIHLPGQTLIVPGAGFVCVASAPPPTEAPTERVIEAAANTAVPAGAGGLTTSGGTPIPTVTLAPTAENAQVTIVQVVAAGM